MGFQKKIVKVIIDKQSHNLIINWFLATAIKWTEIGNCNKKGNIATNKVNRLKGGLKTIKILYTTSFCQ